MAAAHPRQLTWLVTNCSSDLGFSLCRTIQAHAGAGSGHRLIATSRNPQETPDLVRAVLESGPGTDRWLELDFEDEASPGRLIAQLEDEGLSVDVLVLTGQDSDEQEECTRSCCDPDSEVPPEDWIPALEAAHGRPQEFARCIAAQMQYLGGGLVVDVETGTTTCDVAERTKSALAASFRSHLVRVSDVNVLAVYIDAAAPEVDPSRTSDKQRTLVLCKSVMNGAAAAGDTWTDVAAQAIYNHGLRMLADEERNARG